MTGRSPAAVAFLGFGLIGGSIARALAAPPAQGAGHRPRITAWTPSGRGPAQALADGIIDDVAPSPGAALDGADLVVIAAPPIEAIALVRRLGADLAAFLAPESVVTDVTSTKRAMVAAAREARIRFVGGHPMAGRETTGYASASADLFIDRPWIIVRPTDTPDTLVDPVRWLAERCGARPIEMSARAHDAATAAVSHLPLVAAAALVEAVVLGKPESWAVARALTASGWAGATRLALGDPRMGAGILATNALEVAANVRALRDVLGAWLDLLESGDGPDPEALERRLEAARSSLVRGEGPER